MHIFFGVTIVLMSIPELILVRSFNKTMSSLLWFRRPEAQLAAHCHRASRMRALVPRRNSRSLPCQLRRSGGSAKGT